MARILVVDDDPDILEALELALSGRHEVVPARDGLDALERLERSTRFDLVLLDLMMPRMSGSELVRALHARGVAVPVIIASAAHDVRAQAEELGVRDYLAKPFSLKALRAKIAGVLAPGGGGAPSSGGVGGPLEGPHEPTLRAGERFASRLRCSTRRRATDATAAGGPRSDTGRSPGTDCCRAAGRGTRAPWQRNRNRSRSNSSSSSSTGRTSRRPSTRTALRS